MVTYIKSDLEFILKQIQLSEAHAAGQPLYGPGGLIPAYNIAWGLRTVDGTYNHLLPGQENWGSSDQQFSEGLGTDFRPADGGMLDPDGPGPAPEFPTQDTYAPSNDPNSVVIDSSLRTISNLIVDQTLTNPAAIMVALERNGVAGDHLAIALDIKAVYDPLVPLFKAVDDAEDEAAEAAAAAAAANPPDPVLDQEAMDAAAALVAAQDALTAARGPLDALLAANGIELDGANVKLTNIAPDEGLSASFNSWFTLFGQFFDHGLDLVGKGGSGTVFVPLQPDDPLFDPTSPTNFMVLTRATVEAGPDNVMGTADDVRPINTTTPFVDQNQTYASHASHQVFLREYELNTDGDPVATGKLIEGGTGGMATWADLKAQAADLLGIQLVDANVGNVPLLATDEYGNFIRGANGFPQMVIAGANPGDPPTLLEGDPSANGGAGVLVPANAVLTGHAFLADIAHNAVPDGLADGDIEVGLANNDGSPATDQEYDNELLDAHFMAGDGRANENIGLTAVHHVFHSEHNRLVDHAKDVILATGDAAFIAEWQLPDGSWNGERIFQAAKFGTEMQYQHLVFEEFARKISPSINGFLVPDGFDTTMDPSIVAEFAHVVYRFGHSMLTETIDRFDPEFTPDHITLIEGFLNPLQYENNGTDAPVDAEIAAGAVIRGMTRQAGNEIDEFVTSALRNNLLGLPLDLPTINLARGRDVGVPALNAVREQFYEASNQNILLKPYESWVDYAGHLKNEASIINFIAAYGTHDLITTQTTIEGKRDAALTIITGQSVGGLTVPPDAVDFLNGLGAYAGDLGGLNNVDLWIGGLAEEIMPFGGMLGSTFGYVFEIQLEALQSGDRFYYLQRLDGLHLFGEMENNSFASMIMRNTNATHLPSDVFSTPGLILEVDQSQQFNPDTGVFLNGGPDGVLGDNPLTTNADESADDIDPDGIPNNGDELPGPDGVLGDNPLTTNADESLDDVMDTNADPVGNGLLTQLVIRNDPSTAGPDTNYLRYTGGDHVVLGGTDAADKIIAGIGDDTLYGDGGNDRLEGGFGNDIINGGDGDDIITDAGGDDNIKAGAGNDVVHAGGGLDLVLAGSGNDFVFLGTDEGSEVFAGEGDDFIYGNKNAERILGNEGNDWIETGTFDGAPGDNFDEVFAEDGIDGHDVFLGDGGFDEYIGEGGDDIMVGSAGRGKMVGMSGFDWATYKDNTFGVNADIGIPIVFDESPVLPENASLDEYESVEGLSGTIYDDVLTGTDETAATLLPIAQGGTGGGFAGSMLDAEGIARIAGLQEVLGADVTEFGSGDIILGGDGSDLITGKAGDDIIDGDKWLDVQIGVFAVDDPDHTGEPLELHNSMTTLASRMFSGEINPGRLSIVRTIREADGVGDTDIAVFSDDMENYSIVFNGDGSIQVTHVTVSDGLESDGSDRISNVETLRFRDQDFSLNAGPVGLPTISDTTPTQGQNLTADTAGITDANGLGAFSFQWESSADGVTWNAIAGANSGSFTATAAQINQQLRVVVSYTDGGGTAEVVVSEATSVVGMVFNGTNAANSFNGTEGEDHVTGLGGIDTLSGNGGPDLIDGGAGNDIIDGDAGNDTLLGAGGADTMDGGADDDTLDGGAGNDTMTGGDGNDALDGGAGNDLAVFAGPLSNYEFALNGTGGIVVTDTVGTEGADTLTNVERMSFDGQISTIVNGTNGPDALSSAGGSQILLGHDGDDSINGGAASDVIDGGAGNDTITQAGAAAGRDIVRGGADTDTYVVNGNNSAETYRVYARDAALAAGILLSADTEIAVTRNGTDTASVIAELSEIEEIVINTAGGADTVLPIGDFGPTSLLFNTITIDGDTGDDTIDITSLGSEHRIVFKSNGGNDTIIGTLRPQDVIELPNGATVDDYVKTVVNGVTTLTNGNHSVTYTAAAEGDPQVGQEEVVEEVPEGEPPVVGPAPVAQIGTPGNDLMTGTEASDHLIGFAGDDVLIGLGGKDVLLGNDGNDFLAGWTGEDSIFAGAGDDTILAGEDADLLYGDDGDDRIFADGGDDMVTGGAGNDTVVGGAGDDMIVAGLNDGDDAYFGDEINGGSGIDTLDMSAITANAVVDLGTGMGGRGSASSAQSGADTLWGIENVVTGSGNDTIVASNAVNVMDGGAGGDTFVFKSIEAANGDTIVGFETGDKLDLSAIDADTATAGNQSFTLVNGAQVAGVGQLLVSTETRADGDYTVIEGNVGNGDAADFKISIRGTHDLTASDFNL